MARILVVDDEPHMRRILASNLRRDKHEIEEASGVQEARATLAAKNFDLTFTDQTMPDGEGLEVMAAVHESNPTIPVIVLTAPDSIAVAVEAMRRGAFDFLTKPFHPDVVRVAANRALQHAALVRENALLHRARVRLEGKSHIYGGSAGIQAVRDAIARVAPMSAPVLITGETGTGKGLVARAIHQGSPRAHRPFVVVNCAAFTETLLESELFGHEKGAFRGADRARQGLFEAAHEGTLFLDEAGELALAAQARLLTILTGKQFFRVGSSKPRTADVRVLMATHCDLPQRVRDGLFRKDVYSRLAAVSLDIPPLRERREDVSLLAEFFARQIAAELSLPSKRLSARAVQALTHYDFPGNVRELKNLIERAYILSAQEEIGPEDFPFVGARETSPAVNPGDGQERTGEISLRLPAEPFNLTAFLEKSEKELILRTLSSTNGAQAEAARRMGLSRSALAYKLNKYGIRASAQ